MGRLAGWMKQLTGRDKMRSPGAPSLRREVERQFWVQIATWITSERAAEGKFRQARGYMLTGQIKHRGGLAQHYAGASPDRIAQSGQNVHIRDLSPMAADKDRCEIMGADNTNIAQVPQPAVNNRAFARAP